MFWMIFQKEWLQHRWKLALGLFALLSICISYVSAQRSSSAESIVVICCVGGLLLVLYNSMSVFGSENSDRTLGFLLSKSAASWQIFWAKWLMGWINVIVPVLLCGVALWLHSLQMVSYSGRSMNSEWRIFAGTIPLLTIMYHLAVCLTPRRASEGKTALYALVLAGFLMMHAIVIEYVGTIVRFRAFANNPSALLSGICDFLTSIHPMVFVVNMGYHHKIDAVAVIAQLVIFIAVIPVGLRKAR